MVKHKLQKYVRGTYEELDAIDRDMQEVVGLSLRDYIWERVIKPWVAQSPNLPKDLLETPLYISRNWQWYRLRLYVDGKLLYYGTYYSKEECMQIKDYLLFRNSPKELSATFTKLNGKTYREWIVQKINEDEEYQKYLREDKTDGN